MVEEKKDYDQILNNLEVELTNKQKKWSKIIVELSSKINCELKYSIDLSAEATSFRQLLNDEKTQYYFMIYKDLPKMKQIRKNRFEFYATKYPSKTNASEKVKLIESDIAYIEAKMDFLQNHINYLTESMKTVDHVIYSVKNKIELFNATGMD